MKRRMKHTYKILAVLATAGCTPSGPTAATADPTSADAGVEDEPGHAARIESKQGGDQAEPGVVERAPLEPGSNDPALNTLLAELFDVGKTGALADVEHFRPLCDDAGYPVVGNVNRKTSEPSYQPSEFCGEVRTKEAQ